MNIEKIPDAPDFINERAKEIYLKTCKFLIDNDKFNICDIELIVAYAFEMEIYEDACRKLGSQKIFKSPNGYPIISPIYTLKNQSLKQAQKLAESFGLTPNSRLSIKDDMNKKIKTKFATLTAKPKIA